MFNVMWKSSWCKVTVFDVSYDSNGAPLFLVYDRANHAWVRKAAKHFLPVDRRGAYEQV